MFSGIRDILLRNFLTVSKVCVTRFMVHTVRGMQVTGEIFNFAIYNMTHWSFLIWHTFLILVTKSNVLTIEPSDFCCFEECTLTGVSQNKQWLTTLTGLVDRRYHLLHLSESLGICLREIFRVSIKRFLQSIWIFDPVHASPVFRRTLLAWLIPSAPK